MKIKITKKPYSIVSTLPPPKKKNPPKPSAFFKFLANVISCGELNKVKFKCDGKLDKKQGPYMIFMNHSAFIDFEIAFRSINVPFNVVCTYDTMLTKEWLMRRLGCIPTKKFMADMGLISDMRYALKNGRSVLMYPEAGYSFDGKATVLPQKLGRLIKILGVPLAYLQTFGAFSFDPLYNGLRKRKVEVKATLKTILTKEEIKSKSADEIDDIIKGMFSFDNFRYQQEYNIKITEPTRAIGLERVLYKCTCCDSENTLEGKGDRLVCSHCGAEFVLSETGFLCSDKNEVKFNHVPDWYNWERECVKEEIKQGKYCLDCDVDIMIMRDYKQLYNVGKGKLHHDVNGFTLVGEDGLNVSMKPLVSYTLNADFFWYELGDVICIGDNNTQYYCIVGKDVSVAKARLATEELYKITKNKTKD